MNIADILPVTGARHFRSIRWLLLSATAQEVLADRLKAILSFRGSRGAAPSDGSAFQARPQAHSLLRGVCEHKKSQRQLCPRYRCGQLFRMWLAVLQCESNQCKKIVKLRIHLGTGYSYLSALTAIFWAVDGLLEKGVVLPSPPVVGRYASFPRTGSFIRFCPG